MPGSDLHRMWFGVLHSYTQGECSVHQDQRKDTLHTYYYANDEEHGVIGTGNDKMLN